MKKTPTSSKVTPRDLLTPAVLQILLSLTAGSRHGYGIKRDVEDRTGGTLKLGPGTLYEAIHRLLQAGLVDHAKTPPAVQAGGRRKYYRLTGAGRKVLLEELERLDEIVSFARRSDLLPDRGRP